MAQSGYTPLLSYGSTTATNVPLAANLTTNASGVELAVNAADGKLFYKDTGGIVQVLASKAGNVNVSSFSAGTTGFTPNTATTGVVTLAGTLNVANGGTGVTTSTGSGNNVLSTSPTLVTPALGTPSSGIATNLTGLPLSTGVTGTLITTNGGTGLTSYTAGDLPYYAAGTLLSKLAIGTSGQILTSSGTAPQWSTLSGVAVTTFSAGTTGFTPSSATSGAVTLGGTLATTNGGTGLTSFTANGVVYASSTSALTTGSALAFDGYTLQVFSGSSTPALKLYGAAVTQGQLQFSSTSGYGIQGGPDYTGLVYNVASSSFQHIFNIAGSEQMRLTTTGLGIGTSSPVAPLHVYRASASSVRIDTDASASNTQLNFAIAGLNKWSLYRPGSSADLRMFDNATAIDVMTWQVGGNVGIGTSSPSVRLSVVGSTGTLATFTNGATADFSIICGSSITSLNAGGANILAFQTGGTERARIDSSGNFMVGTTSSTAKIESRSDGNSIQRLLVLRNNFASAGSAGSRLGFGTYRDIDANNLGAAIDCINVAGNVNGNLAQGGSLVFSTAADASSGIVERARIDSSGNLLVGTTSAGYSAAGRGLIEINGSSNALLALKTGNTNRGYLYTQGSDMIAWAETGSFTVGTATAYPIAFTTNNTERARIDSSGNLLVGTTGSGFNGGFAVSPAAGNTSLVIGHVSGTSSGQPYTYFTLNSSVVGSITQSGTTAVLYNTTSDQRLKENIADADSASTLIDALQVRKFDWKADGSHQRYGFVAQELATVYSEAVHQPEDTEQMMAVDYSKLVPLLVKEIQSLKARLDAANL